MKSGLVHGIATAGHSQTSQRSPKQMLAASIWARKHEWLPIAIVLPLLAVGYLATLQTIPNGSSQPFMVDVGETQIVLNEWGSLHATGYPLYVISGNILTTFAAALGIGPFFSAAAVSTLWGLMALALVYRLALRWTGQPWLAAGMVLLLGLTRDYWLHAVIAEIYTFTLWLLLLLFSLAEGQRRGSGRLYGLALLGGFAVFHHRAIAMSIPALLAAALTRDVVLTAGAAFTAAEIAEVRWRAAHGSFRRALRTLGTCLILGALGLSQYLWLWLRARAGADWIYGQPDTLRGLWDEISGAEAANYTGLPESLPALLENFQRVNHALITNLTLPGALLGVLGLVLALRLRRWFALPLALNALGPWLFHVFLYHDLLVALLLPIGLSLAFGWLYLGDALLRAVREHPAAKGALVLIVAVATIYLIRLNFPHIQDLTTDTTGLKTIDTLDAAPPDSTVMLAWGTRYFAAASAQLYLGRLEHITLVDDKGDLAVAFAEAALVTPAYTFFRHPPQWWSDRLGQPVYLSAVAPRLVRISPMPRLSLPAAGTLRAAAAATVCAEGRISLAVTWQAGASIPEEDLSVFVKAYDGAGQLIAQGDQSAPVYGWRPLTSWLAGETIVDFYPLAVAPERVTLIRYGLYRTTAPGEYEDTLSYEIEPNCQQAS